MAKDIIKLSDFQNKESRKKRVVDAKEFCARCGFSLAKFYREIQSKRIPKPIKLGYRMARWYESDVDEYLDRMAAESRNAA